MLSYVALSLALFGALWWMPVRIAGRIDLNRTPTARLDCTIWRVRLRYDAVVERQEGSLALHIRRRGSKRKPEEPPELVASIQEVLAVVRFFRSHPRSLAHLQRVLRLQALGIFLRVGTGDAAYTAQLHGLCCTALLLIAQAVHRRKRIWPRVRALGDYRESVFLCSVDCIIAFHVGNIIGTGLLVALEGIASRMRAPKSGA